MGSLTILLVEQLTCLGECAGGGEEWFICLGEQARWDGLEGRVHVLRSGDWGFTC